MSDRLSGLPDELLHNILTHLDLQKAISTSILSQRWRLLWTTMPTIDLGIWERGGLYDVSIPSKITHSLDKFGTQQIRKFTARFSHDKLRKCDLDSWVKFAINHDVEEFHMILIKNDDSLDVSLNASRWGYLDMFFHFGFELPGCLFNCKSLAVLNLSNCDLDLHSFSLCFLKELELHYVWLSDFDTSACPLLESIILHECNPRVPLNIYAPNLKLRYLEIFDIYRRGCVTLFAPNLQSIQFYGNIREAYSIKDLLSSLQVATLDIKRGRKEPKISMQSLLDILKMVRHAATLRLSKASMRFLSNQSPEFSLPRFKATRMEIGVTMGKPYLMGMALALSSSLSLETLILEITFCKIYEDTEESNYDDIWESVGSSLAALGSLKKVEIKSFLGSQPELLNSKLPECMLNSTDFVLKMWEKEINLVKVLLGSCILLETMTISTIENSSMTQNSELLLTLEKLFPSFPRASANADINVY